MDFLNLIEDIDHPKPYVSGTHIMWTDNYISSFLLEAHLDPEIGAASRSFSDIDKTIKKIESLVKPEARILDLGCGPGLYTERLSQNGYDVTGVDFSKLSINYAQEQAAEKNLNITYIIDDYLNLDFNNQFDLIMMIYCDFGVLLPDDRTKMIKNIKCALKPGGIFLFDSINREAVETMSFTTSWELTEKGFYSPMPYLLLSSGHHFPDHKAILDQHVVIQEDNNPKVYRFWNHYFEKEVISNLFIENGFTDFETVQSLLSGEGPYNDNSVVFYVIHR